MKIRSVLAPLTAGAVVLAALVGMPAAQAAKAPGGVSDFTNVKNFCKSVQIATADLDKAQAKALKIKNTVRPTLNRFVASKARTKPNRTQQHTVKTATGEYQIWCKGRSVDAIKDVYGKKAAGKEKGCVVALRRERNQIWKSLTPRQQRKAAYDRKDIKVKKDKEEAIGPMWALPKLPFQAVREGKNGKLRLQAHGLYVSIDHPSPGPDEFKGNHYCKLPHPDYLRSVIRKGLPAA